MLSRIRQRRETRHAVAQVYVCLVEQARRPEFFVHLGVPDTVMGRFNAVALHAFLLLHRLKGEGASADLFAQALFDHMFADMDRNLRELGVGDLSVGKKVKSLAKSFYGRTVAYERGLLSDDDGDLEASLRRNLYDGVVPDERQIEAMIGYLRSEVARLAATPAERIFAGECDFAGPLLPAGWTSESQS